MQKKSDKFDRPDLRCVIILMKIGKFLRDKPIAHFDMFYTLMNSVSFCIIVSILTTQVMSTYWDKIHFKQKIRVPLTLGSGTDHSGKFHTKRSMFLGRAIFRILNKLLQYLLHHIRLSRMENNTK